MVQSAGWYPLQAAAPVPAAPPAVRAAPQVEIEGDGLEGQRPPRRRTAQTPDDPTEPFSPNYGSVPAAAADDAPEPA